MLPTSPSLETAIQKATKRKEELERWREEKRLKMLQAKLQPPPVSVQQPHVKPKPLPGVASRFQLTQPVRAPVAVQPVRAPAPVVTRKPIHTAAARPPVLAVRSLNHPRPAFAVKPLVVAAAGARHIPNLPPPVTVALAREEELDIEKQAAFSPQQLPRPASPLPEPVLMPLLQTPPKPQTPPKVQSQLNSNSLGCGGGGLTPCTEDEDSLLPATPLLQPIPPVPLLDTPITTKEEEEVPTPRIQRTPIEQQEASAGEETYNVSLLLLANDTLVHHLEDCERRRTVECLALREERDELQYELQAMQQRFNSHIRKMEQSMQNQLQLALDRIEELTQALEDANGGGARTPTTATITKRKRKIRN